MEKLRDEGAGRRDVPQHVSGSDLWPSSTGMHLRAQPFDNEGKPTQDDARSMSESDQSRRFDPLPITSGQPL